MKKRERNGDILATFPISDKSAGTSKACLFHPSCYKVAAGQKIKRVRGFVHAEEPGEYVLLSDKEEDIVM